MGSKKCFLYVRRSTLGNASLGILQISPTQRTLCILGAGGIKGYRREGDKSTPRGCFRFLQAYYRPDRLPRPTSALPLFPLHPGNSWGDTPFTPDYNRFSKTPPDSGHESLWRTDAAYNVLIVLEINRRPRIQGAGSALFLHALKDPFLPLSQHPPTQGCIACTEKALLQLLKRATQETFLVIL